MSGTRVLVAGASIAGPALAHWLRRRGAEVTVVERAPGLRPGGQAVDARGVTKEVIRRMGLDAAVRAARTETAGAYTVDVAGKVLETYRADDDGGDGYISEIEILRGDLSRVLHDDTRDGVEYIFGDRIAELTQDADGADVTFAGGGRRRFDLVVGADGLHSALRAMVFGPHERFVRHLGHVMAFYTVPNEFGLDRWLIDYQDSGSGRSAGLRPIQDATRAMAMFSFPAAGLDVDYRDVVAQKRLLRERMAGLGWLAPRILAHLDHTPDFYLDQVAQVVMDRWSSGRSGCSGTRRSARRRCPGRAPAWPWSAPTCWPESWPPPGGTRRPGSPATRGGCARSSRPTRRSAGCTRAAATSPGRTPSQARISTPGGSPSWSSARSTAPSCPTTRGCRTPGPRPDRRSPHRPCRKPPPRAR
jgi:2-polyprenyl-6-methoxyphenol hydroxylase-like FAD-dependent oxidoreductase